MPSFGRNLRALVAAFPVFLAAPAAIAAPGDTLFSDDFERAAIAPWTTTNAANSGILSGAQVSSSPTRGLFTRRGVVTTTSPTFAQLL